MPGGGYEFKAFKYSSHFWIAELLANEKKGAKILDVGTAGGYLGKILTERGHCVTGIEGDPNEAEKAKGYYRAFYTVDIEKFDFPFAPEFDVILFADVLEHLRDPVAVLRRCLPALKESGKIIISVPNVANIFVRLSLLFGRFDYTDRGILDKTHLRFFTLRSARKMMSEVHCRVVRVVPTLLPVQIVFPFTRSKLFGPLHEAHYAVARMWKTLFAYQFVITAMSTQGTGAPSA